MQNALHSSHAAHQKQRLQYLYNSVLITQQRTRSLVLHLTSTRARAFVAVLNRLVMSQCPDPAPASLFHSTQFLFTQIMQNFSYGDALIASGLYG
jgi:hypothetical protein